MGLTKIRGTLQIEQQTVNSTIVTDNTLLDTDFAQNSKTTAQGNIFNGADQLVQTLSDGKLPILDGSNLTGVSPVETIATSDLTDVEGAVNSAAGLLKLDGAGALPALDGSSLTGVGDFEDGGESTGANRSIGNNDAFSLSFRTNNSDRITITSGGTINLLNAPIDNIFRLEVAVGSEDDPRYRFIGDTDTGMWHPGANILAWSTNAVERMRIGTTGQVDLAGQIKIAGGVPGAGKVLTDVGGTGLATWETPSGGGDFSDGGEAGGADRSLGNTDNFGLSFLTNSIARITIADAGQVGFNQPSPTAGTIIETFRDFGGGITAKAWVQGSGAEFETEVDNAPTNMQLSAAGAGFHGIVSMKCIGGTHAAPSATQIGVLGQVDVKGHDGTAVTGSRGRIRFSSTENWASGANGNKIEFFTTPNLSSIPGIGMTIDQDKRVIFESDVQVKGGAPGAGKVLTDVGGTGLATWETPSGGGDFADGGEAGGADRTLGNTDAFDLGFLTSGSARLTIKDDGKIGVGHTAPRSEFHIAKDSSVNELIVTAAHATSPFPGVRFESSLGTIAAPTAVTAFRGLGFIGMLGHDGDRYPSNPPASIFGQATESWRSFGELVSATGAATTLTGGEDIDIGISSEATQNIVLAAASADGDAIAADIQTKVRTLTASSGNLQVCYDNFTCTFNAGAPAQYTLTAGSDDTSAFTATSAVIAETGTGATALLLDSGSGSAPTPAGYGNRIRLRITPNGSTLRDFNALVVTGASGESRVGLGVFNPSEKLHVVGNIRATGTIISDLGPTGGPLTNEYAGTHIIASTNTAAVGNLFLYPLDSAGGIFTFTLSTSDASTNGKMFIIKDIVGSAGTNTITIATEGGETIDGAVASTFNMTSNFDTIRLMAIDSAWVTW